jgi:hypothetical protein
MIDDKLVHEALQRFARTPDGRVFYIGLQKVLMAVVSSEQDGALRENLGRRRFASELMAVMAEVMSEIEPSDDPRGRPIVFTLSKPVAGARTRGARRRVSGPQPGADSSSSAD